VKKVVGLQSSVVSYLSGMNVLTKGGTTLEIHQLLLTKFEKNLVSIIAILYLYSAISFKLNSTLQ